MRLGITNEGITMQINTYVSTYILSEDFDYVKLLSIIYDCVFFPGDNTQISNLIEEIRSLEKLKHKEVTELRKIWQPLEQRVNPVTNAIYRLNLWDKCWVTPVDTGRGRRPNLIDLMIIDVVNKEVGNLANKHGVQGMALIMRLRNILDACSVANASYSTMNHFELRMLVSLLENLADFWIYHRGMEIDYPEINELRNLPELSSKLAQDFSPILTDFVDLELPDFRELSWEGVLYLRRSSATKDFKQWLLDSTMPSLKKMQLNTRNLLRKS